MATQEDSGRGCCMPITGVILVLAVGMVIRYYTSRNTSWSGGFSVRAVGGEDSIPPQQLFVVHCKGVAEVRSVLIVQGKKLVTLAGEGSERLVVKQDLDASCIQLDDFLYAPGDKVAVDLKDGKVEIRYAAGLHSLTKAIEKE